MVGDINHIIVIESLVDEKLTGTELYLECISRYIAYKSSKMTKQIYSTYDKFEFVEILKYIKEVSPYMSGGLLLHFEMHGSEKQDGLVLADDSLITWEELVDLFRPININTCNKLYISMATCNGRMLYAGVDGWKKSPYSCYISASKDVYPDEIINQFTVLFTKLIDCGNLVEACLEMEKEGTSFYYKDSEQTFEENFKNVRESPSIREELRENITNDYQKAGLEKLSEEAIEMLIDSAMSDSYTIHKAAFNFSDCD